MIEIFKKGQIVPRRLRLVLSKDRKAQHCAVFCCDVINDGLTVTPLHGEFNIILLKPAKRRMNNGTYKSSLFVSNGLCFGGLGTAAPTITRSVVPPNVYSTAKLLCKLEPYAA